VQCAKPIVVKPTYFPHHSTILPPPPENIFARHFFQKPQLHLEGVNGLPMFELADPELDAGPKPGVNTGAS
jgi:hypothetical protein